MTKKAEKKVEPKRDFLADLEKSRDDYVAYQNKMEGNSLIDPTTVAHVLLGLQKDILNIYTLLIEMEKKK